MYDIIIIGSGPSSCFMTYYLLKYYQYSICLITNKLQEFHCTYGIFKKQLEDGWFLEKDNFSDCFINEFNCQIQSINRKSLKIKDERYMLLDNKKCFKKLLDFFKSKELDIIEAYVYKIDEDNNNKRVYFKKNNKEKVRESKLVIEGTGHKKSIGINYIADVPITYQSFFGYKLKTSKPHGIKDVILMDWYEITINDDSDIPSFCYFIPYSDNILLAEETVIIHLDNDINYLEILELRLKKRLKKYNIKYEIISKENGRISVNRFIPDSNSLSFGIGVNGNIVSPISGYSVGLNIHNIPIITELIKKNNLNTKKIYQSYWNFFRKLIFLINYSGNKLVLSFKNNQESSQFFYNFISKTNNNKEQFNIVFHNIYGDKLKFLMTCYIYLFMSKKITLKLLYNSLIIFILYFYSFF